MHRRFSTSPQLWHRWVFDRLDIPPEARVLELGAGRGELWRDNHDRVPAGWRLTLTDFSRGMVEAAHASGVKAEFAVVDAQAIPFGDESFDAVLANHMLYHLPDRPRALAEIRRVLVPGGRLYATTIGRRHLLELKELAEAVSPGLVWSESPERFGLETGAAQLEPLFADVELELFEDALEVTEAQAVVLFLRSLGQAAGLDEDAVRAPVEAEIARRGSFRIEKASGLFRCRKP